MSDVTITDQVEKHLILYRNMSAAIAKCYKVDECKDIIDKSVGLSAYYKQIQDTETERMFYQIRLRAWRRIGELLSAVDISDCTTAREKIERIRKAFDDEVVAEFSDSRITELLRLMTLSDADFEHAVQKVTSGGVAAIWHHTPQAEAQSKANKDATEQMIKENAKKSASPEYQKKMEDEALARAMRARHEFEFRVATEDALRDVGLTLERKDRARLKQVLFLIKEDVHAVMRQAAFDKKITMQELLRRGLKMYLIANDYEFPEDVSPKTSPAPRAERTAI